MPDEERVAELIGEWLERRERGEEVSPEELVEGHPDLAPELREHLDALGLLTRHFHGEEGEAGESPREIGEYRVVREIGRGGMGVVYEAEQTSMGRRVALKVLSPAVTSVHQAVQRFRREARAAGQLHHTNIVPVYGMGQDRGLWYYAMELVEGETLADVVTEMRERRDAEGAGKPPSEGEGLLGLSAADGWDRFAGAMAGVAEALETAHQEGIIHRDIKPTNLMLAGDGTLKLVDFGLARLSGGEGASMTVTGQLLGTPHYMSPEQAMARRVPIDHRTDVYSLGATLYEVLTLRTPFQGDTLHEICSQIIAKDPVPVRKANPRVPRDLETIVAKAMEKDRDKRYASAGEMARDLRRFAEGVPIRARPIGPVGRAWRRVKRNKVRAALVTTVVVLVAAGSLVALRAAREAERRKDLEYVSLCARAEEALRLREPLEHDGPDDGEFPGAPVGLLTDAIALLPDRPEAHLLRSLAPGRELRERLADLDAARARGLPEDTWRLGRAHLLRREGRSREAEAEARAVLTLEPSSPIGAYFRARLEAAAGRRSEALRLLDRAVAEAEPRGSVRHLALRSRARLRAKAGDHGGALADLHAVRAAGDDGVETRVRTALCWRRLGQEDRAQAVFRESLESAARAGTSSAWRRLCVVCRSIRELDWQDAATAAALRTVGETEDLLVERGIALRRAGRPDEALEALVRACELGPRSARAHLIRGETLAGLDRPAEARDAFRAAVDLDPGLVEAHKGRGVALERLGEDDAALLAYERAIELDPTYGNARVRRWRLLHRLGRTDEVLEELEEVAARGLAGLRLQAHMLFELGRHEEALNAADAAVGQGARSAGLLVERANALSALGRTDEALVAYDEVIEEHASNHEAHEGRSGILLERERWSEALAALDRAVETNPRCAGAHVKRGRALHGLERFDEACAAFESAIGIDASHVEAHVWLGSLLHDDLDEPGRAREILEQATGLDPENAVAWSCLGIVRATLEDHEGSRRAFERACELAPRDASIWYDLGKARKRAGDLKGARLAFRRSVDLDLENAGAWLHLGTTLGVLGRTKRALEALDEAARLDPELWEVHYERGVCLGTLGEIDDAIEAYQRAVAMKPDAAGALYNLANGLHHREREEEAVEIYDRVIPLTPEDHRPRFNRGLALFDLERYAEALAAFDDTLRVNSSFARAHGYRGRSLAIFHRHGEAEAAFTVAMRLEPDDLRWRWCRADARRETCRLEAALEDLNALRETLTDNGEIEADRAVALALLGRLEEAREARKRARELSPHSTYALAGVVRTLALEGAWEKALAAVEDLVAKEPGQADLKVRCLLALDRSEDARTAAAEASKDDPPAFGRIRVAYLCAVAGEREKALGILEAIELPWPPFGAWERARVHAVLGDADAAIAWLTRAVEGGLRWPVGVVADPEFRKLETDPRFRALLERLRGKE